MFYINNSFIHFLQSIGVSMGVVASDDELKQAIKQSASLQGPLIVKFGAEWCGPCKRIEARFHELIKEFNCEFPSISLSFSWGIPLSLWHTLWHAVSRVYYN